MYSLRWTRRLSCQGVCLFEKHTEKDCTAHCRHNVGFRPLDRPDPRLERVAKANGFSLHAGVSCKGKQKDKRERLCRYIARPAVAVPRLSLSSTGKVVYTPEDALPGWNDPGSLRPCRFHSSIGGTGSQAQGQSHSLSRRTGTEPPMAWRGHPSQTWQGT
jgi:hypothetical protein